jgi:hypothetical protein
VAHIYRVIVRGFFGELDGPTRAGLLAEADEHEPLAAAFTTAGTLTYDRRLVAFSLRYEMRRADDADDPSAAVSAEALARATDELRRAGIPYTGLRVQAIDMADAWRR